MSKRIIIAIVDEGYFNKGFLEDFEDVELLETFSGYDGLLKWVSENKFQIIEKKDDS